MGSFLFQLCIIKYQLRYIDSEYLWHVQYKRSKIIELAVQPLLNHRTNEQANRDLLRFGDRSDTVLVTMIVNDHWRWTLEISTVLAEIFDDRAFCAERGNNFICLWELYIVGLAGYFSSLDTFRLFGHI